ncbi:MAG: hypothetical protein U9R60_02780, partial [Bacteroidota bacterium]|nr:hypothetical protein [Bacteroidota bacterium]
MMKIYKAFMLLVLIALIAANPSFSQEKSNLNPVVYKAKYFRVTKPLRDMEQIAPGIRQRSWKDNVIRNENNTKTANIKEQSNDLDLVVQHKMGTQSGRSQDQNFDGVNNVNGVYPPDTDGDVGPNHYFQMVNLSFAIYDKTGNLLYGPVDNSTLWNGFIGAWTGTNDGDPIVLYDEMADRWMASQFAINTSNGTYWQLIAISQTSDPTGAYYQYAFQFPAFNDYPKFGVWPDGYYASFNMFGTYTRVAAAAFERTEMLNGNPNAQMVLFDLAQGSDPWGMLPSDFDGTAPPTGAPNYFAYFNDNAWGYSNDHLRVWEFTVDWTTPANSTFTETLNLPTAAFDYEICSAYRGRCIPQPNTTRKLETISDRLMYRLQYRNFGTHEVMLTNHTVDAGSGVAGIRWYELRDAHDGNGWQIYQQGTYSPDNDHRWMGSVAMDANGNIALGYTVSNSSLYPSIRYTGRYSTDPLGQMTMVEDEIIAGSGSQTGSACRWGDYSCMSLDPSNPTTFWYTTEYLQTTGGAPWRTRIASFYFQPPLPTANAGANLSTCELDPVQLNGSASNYSSVMWYTSGDGSFDDPTLLNATYTPGPGDLTSENADLWLTAYAVPPATDSIADTTLLSVMLHASALAGNDTIICEDASFYTQASSPNAGSVLWSTNGDGTFDNPNILEATYFPGITDLSNGSVELSLTAYSVAPCSSEDTDQLILSFQPLADADAGTDDAVCEDGVYQLAGIANNYNSLLWTTSGDGTFSNTGILNPEYTPGINDIINGSVTLTLTAYAISPCTVDSADDMELTIDPLPIVDAGDDQTIQYSTTTTISGTASGGSGSYAYQWTPAYLVVSPNSLTTETVNMFSTTVFTLTITDNTTDCVGEDDMMVTVEGGPLQTLATADPDLVCFGENSQLNAVTSGGSGTYIYDWVSNPAGFTSTLQNPVCTPNVSTTYTVTADDGINITTSDVFVSVQQLPIANAGEDSTICEGESIILYGIANYASATLWTTAGDGTFDNASFLNAIYAPGSNDILNGGVDLTLSSSPIGPCPDAAQDLMHLGIEICSGIIDHSTEQLGIKILPNPNNGAFKLLVNGLKCQRF